jgi:molybdopterin converting factor small subunit
MQINLKFFASLREAVGTSQETLVLTSDLKTAGQVKDFLCQRGGVWAEEPALPAGGPTSAALAAGGLPGGRPD